jgi:hypothetical protein
MGGYEGAERKLYPEIEVSFSGDEIPIKILTGLWKTFKPKKEMPNIKAYNVIKEEFLKICETIKERLIKAGIDPAESELFEYGKKIGEKAAFVIPSKTSGDYYIFRRNDSLHTIEYDLLHELRHIYSGDVETVNRKFFLIPDSPTSL